MADEKIYTIPLREAKKKARVKRTPYAVKIVRNYLTTHTKAKEVKFGKMLNEELWKRGIKKPPAKIRVKVIKDGDILKAELVGFEYEDFKTKPKSEKKGMKERLMSRLGPKAMKKEEEEKKIDGKEGKESAAKEIAKAEHIEKHDIEKG